MADGKRLRIAVARRLGRDQSEAGKHGRSRARCSSASTPDRTALGYASHTRRRVPYRLPSVLLRNASSVYTSRTGTLGALGKTRTRSGLRSHDMYSDLERRAKSEQPIVPDTPWGRCVWK